MDSFESELHSAAALGNLEAAELLLKEESNVIFKSEQGKTPLDILVRKGIDIYDALYVIDESLSALLRLPDESKEFLHSHCDQIRVMEKKKGLLVQKLEANEQFLKLLLGHASVNTHQTHDKWLQLFYAACTLKECAIAQTVLEKIADVNQPISENSSVWPGYTGLHFAAHCNIELVKTLVKKGANLLACDAKGVTPLDICTKSFSVEEVHSILTSVSSWKNILFSDGKTKLMNYIHLLLKSNDPTSYLQDVGKVAGVVFSKVSPLWPGYTILHLAVHLLPETQYDRIYRILNSGASVTSQDDHDSTPVHLAFRQGKMKFLNILFGYHEKCLNLMDNDNLSHLHIACAVDNINMVRKLLTIEANVNIVYNGKALPAVKPGWTPLHTACYTNNATVAKMLLDAGAKLLEIDFAEFNQILPLSKVLTGNYDKPLLEVFISLLWTNKKMQQQIEEETSLTMLHIACYALDHKKIKDLLNKKVNVNARIREDFLIWPGYSPLHILTFLGANNVTAGVGQVIKLLLDKEVNGTVTNADGDTPVHLLLKSYKSQGDEDKFAAVIEQLIKLGCDIHQQDREGKTPLHVAIELCNLKAVSALLTCGADINLVDSAGKSPFYYCVRLTRRNRSAYYPMLISLKAYLSKLQLVGLAVSHLNTHLLSQARSIRRFHEDQDSEGEDEDEDREGEIENECNDENNTDIEDEDDEGENYEDSEDEDEDGRVDKFTLFSEVEKTKTEKIGKRGLTLYDFVFEKDVIKIISLFTKEERDLVNDILESIDSKTYGSLRHLLKLQYRKVVERLSLTSPAALSLDTLLGFPMPVLCVENIFKFLTNAELKCLVSAAIDNNDSGMIANN